MNNLPNILLAAVSLIPVPTMPQGVIPIQPGIDIVYWQKDPDGSRVIATVDRTARITWRVERGDPIE